MLGRQELHRAEEVCERAAAVDVAYQERRGAGRLGDAHVHDVGVREVDLCRRAGALDDEDIVLRHELIETGADHRPDVTCTAVPLHARQIIAALAEHDHLRMGVLFGLEQDRVHAHIGYRARRECLKVLRAAHLAARRDARIVAHVLRLERRDFQASTRVPARESGREKALARPAGRAADHDRAGRHGERPCSNAPIAAGQEAKYAWKYEAVSEPRR